MMYQSCMLAFNNIFYALLAYIAICSVVVIAVVVYHIRELSKSKTGCFRTVVTEEMTDAKETGFDEPGDKHHIENTEPWRPTPVVEPRSMQRVSPRSSGLPTDELESCKTEPCSTMNVLFSGHGESPTDS